MSRRSRLASCHHTGRRRSFSPSTWGRPLRFEQLEPRALLSVVPLGPEFRVNTYTISSQERSAAAMDADGDFVVVWDGFASPDGAGIFAQRYNAAGTPQGAEFHVNSYITNVQRVAGVAMDADGDFVVVWESEGQDGQFTGIYAQCYNASGVAQGSEFRVNTYTTSSQSSSAVAMDASGDFVVAWHSYGQDGDRFGVYAQRYNAAGVAQGSEFRVNSYAVDDQAFPTIAMDSDGDSVIAWSSFEQDGSGRGIYAQRYNAAGVAQGSEFRVNSYTTSWQREPDVAMDSDGDFALAWWSQGQDSSSYGVYAQRYNAAGVAQGGEFRVNTYTTGSQRVPRIAMDSDGDMVIAWGSEGQDGSGFGIYAQRYNSAGVVQGSEFRVNTHTTGNQGGTFQEGVSVAMDADGDFVVAWMSYGQDGSNYGVYAQRYGLNNPPTTSGIANVNVSEDAADSIVNLWAAFGDAETADSALVYTVQSNTNPALFTSTNINAGNGQLTLDYAPNAFGSANITVRATDAAAEWVETTFTVNVAAVVDTPGVTNATTFVNQQTSSGLVISRNAADGVEVTHYRITSITNGTLYQNNGTTPINNGDFITAAQGGAGLKFMPALNSPNDGSFQVQAATGPTVGQLGGGTVTATIDVVNTAPTTSGIANVNVAEDAANTNVNLWSAFADAEQADNQLTYAVQSNTNPPLFTSTNINPATGRLILNYAPNAFGSASIAVRATDPAGAFAQTTFTVNVAPINDEQVLATNAGLPVGQGASAAISTSLLQTTDIDDSPANLVYTVTSGPAYGTLRVNGTPASQFTQQDIDASLVRYQHDGSTNFNDSFNFTVNDGEGTVTAGTFLITAKYLGDYDGNGVVGMADYVVFSSNYGRMVTPWTSGDGNGDGVVDSADYIVWRKALGGSGASSSAGSGGAAATTATHDQTANKTVADVSVESQALPNISSVPQAEPELLAVPNSSIATQRVRRVLDARRENRAELEVDNLLLARTVTSLGNDSNLDSAPARAEREHNAHRAALDDVFSILGRNLGQRRGAK